MSEDGFKGIILVVDDELGPRESLRFLFKNQYEVICTSGVDEAVAAFKGKTPDVVLMDIKMPGKTGIDGLREIRQLDADVSIIMLTGFGSLETAQEAIRFGASDYVKKPFDTVEMREIAQSHINKTRMRRGRQAAYDNLRIINEQLQAELSSKEHLAELGQATSEFVHDIRNPLTVICGYVSLLMNNIKDGPALESGSSDTEKTREYLEQMEKSVLRCQEMSQMWRDLTVHGGDARFEPCSMLAILQEVCDTLQGMLRSARAGVDLMAPDGDLRISGDNLQLYRAFQNLGSNAIHALPKDGTGRLVIRLSREGQMARIEVLDNGCGIPADKLESVFQPYVSSKKKTGGMGIGLFITKKVIEKHRGSIRLQNRPEGGIAAIVDLPVPAGS
jgi:signal transduction histidine kinase